MHRKDKMARGNVVVGNQDTNENVMGRSHTNSILDTRTHQVQFTVGKVTDITANIIAVGMSTYSLMCWLIIEKRARPFHYQTNKSQFGADQEPIRPLQAGKFAASGRMLLPHERSCWS